MSFFPFLLAVFLVFPAFAEEVRQISPNQGEVYTITNETEAAKAAEIKKAFSEALSRTGVCVSGDLTKRDFCYCEQAESWNKYKSFLDSTLMEYPHWSGKMIEYQSEDGVSGASLSVRALIQTRDLFESLDCSDF